MSVQVVVGRLGLEERDARDGHGGAGPGIDEVPHRVSGPRDAVAEAVRGYRELHRDVGTAQRVDRPVVLEVDDRKPGQDLPVHRVGHSLAHDGGQEVMGHHPLVVPPGQASGRLEHRQPGEQRGHQVLLPHVVHKLVVKHLQGHVQLEEDQRLVVTGIRHDRLAAGVARHVIDHVWSGGNAPDLAVL